MQLWLTGSPAPEDAFIRAFPVATSNGHDTFYSVAYRDRDHLGFQRFESFVDRWSAREFVRSQYEVAPRIF